MLRSLTISLPNSGNQLTLHSVERVMPIIRRKFGLSPQLTDVVETVADTLDQIGNTYGGDYVTLQPVEPDGIAYLPLHVRKVLAVQRADLYVDNAGSWRPGPYQGRDWVADQINDYTCWRLDNLACFASIRQQWGSHLPFQRVQEGIFLPQYKRRSNELQRAVIVSYQAQLTDERGWPLLTDWDAEAVAHYWMWEKVRRDVYGGVAGAANLLDMARQDMERTVGQARTGEGLSEHDIAFILKTGASWDRATYGAGYSLPKIDVGRRTSWG